MRKKKSKKDWMITKMDMKKAYDRLNWDFIDDTLSDVGFSQPFIKLIMHYLSSCSMQLV